MPDYIFFALMITVILINTDRRDMSFKYIISDIICLNIYQQVCTSPIKLKFTFRKKKTKKL